MTEAIKSLVLITSFLAAFEIVKRWIRLEEGEGKEATETMKKCRPSKSRYYLDIAREVCRRGTCLRRNYGAVIVKEDQIVSTGYTGAPRGATNCIDIGVCHREQLKVPSGERYELCRSVHAEMNAVIHASRQQTLGATMYLAGIEMETGQPIINPEPCLLCRRVIINAGIAKVVTDGANGDIVETDPRKWIDEKKV